jgi:hypothetical protein
MTYSNFATEDIEANRNGYMTPSQAKMLRRSLGSYQGTLIFLSLLLLPILLGAVIIGHDWIVFGLFGLLLLGALGVLSGFQWELWKDAGEATVTSITGKLWSINSGGKGTTQLELHIQDKAGLKHVVLARRNYAKWFKVNTCYTFFCAPRTRILLSAEEITC